MDRRRGRRDFASIAVAVSWGRDVSSARRLFRLGDRCDIAWLEKLARYFIDSLAAMPGWRFASSASSSVGRAVA